MGFVERYPVSPVAGVRTGLGADGPEGAFGAVVVGAVVVGAVVSGGPVVVGGGISHSLSRIA